MPWRQRDPEPVEPPPRAHHPDPVIEQKLQRIYDLNRRITRKEDLIEDVRGRIRDYHRQILRFTEKSTKDIKKSRRAALAKAIQDHDKRILDLGGDIRRIEEEIDAVRDLIEQALAGLSDSDLSYLN